MRVVSFNINGVRARPHQLEELKLKYDPDVIGLQETKVHDEEFPREFIESLGYHVEYYGQKGHYGVALLSKTPPLSVIRGLPSEDESSQRRLITGVYQMANGEEITIMNGYFPQGENRSHETKFPHKERFYRELTDWLNVSFTPKQSLLVIGDINISATDNDIGIGSSNAKRWLREGKCSFLPEEREWLSSLESWGLRDGYRKIHPNNSDKFSWFDYRSKGFSAEPKRGLRIDALLATDSIYDRIIASDIAYDIRGMEKPSDHAPIWIEIKD